jgi:hypothetical protein
VELLCDVTLDRPRGGHISVTGCVPLFLLRKPTPVERVGLIGLKAEGFIVVGYGTVEATALQMDERSAAEGSLGRNRKDSLQSASAPSSRPTIARPQHRPFQ